MRSLITLIGISILMMGSPPAHSTSTWCAVVNANVPDGYLNLRGGPSTRYPALTRLMPRQLIELTTARCAAELNAQRQIIGNVCAPEVSSWVAVEYIRDGSGPFYDPTKHRGWVHERYITQIPCS